MRTHTDTHTLTRTLMTCVVHTQTQEEPLPRSPVEQLPDEILTLVLQRLPNPYILGQVACVCRMIRDLVEVGLYVVGGRFVCARALSF